MRQYWINFNGEQKGPMSMEQIAQMGVDESAYVWHSGLSDWVKITAVPELKEMLENNSQKEQPEERTEQVAEVVENEVAPALPEKEEVPALPKKEVAPQLPNNNVAPGMGYQSRYMPRQVAEHKEPQELPKCPPTNMVWAIISTVFCCTPAGIVAIIFAYLTKKNYNNGDFRRAERMSEYGAWAVIASIILGLITTPLTCASHYFQM